MYKLEDFKAIKIQGMTFQWKVEEPYLYCRVSAPTEGWVAIGFNTSNELSGTNLIMGCVIDSKVMIEDRYIIESGLHKAKQAIGGQDNLSQKSGTEQNGVTTISFALPLGLEDKYTHALREGNSYYLLLAYSREDDFQHHSMMRTSTVITL